MGLAGESGVREDDARQEPDPLDGRMQHMEGTVSLDGVELPIGDDSAMNAFRFEHVSIVPQYAMSALNPIRKIGRMISELLDSRGVSYDETLPELSRRRLALVGLDDGVLDRYPIELSGGQKQRVVMVLSTLLNPSLLIADELTSALDVSTQKAVAEMLVEFRDREFVKSTIVITHDLSILYQIADTILVMYAGKLVEKGPRGAHRRPRHPYTRLLIGSLPEVGVRFSEKRLQGISGRPPSLLDPPTGCRFRDRCPLAFEKCAEEPPFVEVAPGRFAACWKAERPDAPARERHQGLQDRHLRWRRRDRRLGRDLRHPARRGRLADRRERQRQDDGRQDDPPADGRDRRRDHVRRARRSPRSAAASCAATTAASRVSSRIRSARTTRSSRSTACSR